MTVFEFSTRRRVLDSARWEPGPRLLVHIDDGEASVPEQLSWQGQDGTEGAVVFQPEMTRFSGAHRAADGVLAELRGALEGNWPFPEGTGQVVPEGAGQVVPEGAGQVVVHRFDTEEGGGFGTDEGADAAWHPAGELRLLVDDGRQPVERVSWRDRSGNCAWVALRSTAATGTGEVTGLVTAVRASAEHLAGKEIATNLVDGSTFSKWLVFERTAWLEFGLARPVAVMSYALMSANDFPDRDPADWTLLGSDDGEQWTPLDRRTGQRFTDRFQTRGYPIANTRSYRRYRLDINGNAGSAELQLAQFRLFATGSGGFFGYYQRAGEAPTGYRSTPVPHFESPAPAPAAMAAHDVVTLFARATEIHPRTSLPMQLSLPKQRGIPTTPAGTLHPAIPAPGTPRRATPAVQPAEAAPSTQARVGGELATIARVHLTAELAQRWIALLRPAFGLDPEADGPVTGQLGGVPSLPADVAWPVWEGQGPLSFIASIDFGSLATHELDIAVPAAGTLHFFYFDGRFPGGTKDCFDDVPYRHGGSRLVYVPAGIPIEEQRQLAGLRPYPMRRLRARLITTAPDAYHPILAETFGERGILDGSFAKALDELPQNRYAHRLGGYSEPEQWPPERLLKATGPQSSDGGTLLAQFGTDLSVDMQWGDLGSLYWVIRPDDLAQGRFEAAAFEFQCL